MGSCRSWILTFHFVVGSCVSWILIFGRGTCLLGARAAGIFHSKPALERRREMLIVKPRVAHTCRYCLTHISDRVSAAVQSDTSPSAAVSPPEFGARSAVSTGSDVRGLKITGYRVYVTRTQRLRHRTAPVSPGVMGGVRADPRCTCAEAGKVDRLDVLRRF